MPGRAGGEPAAVSAALARLALGLLALAAGCAPLLGARPLAAARPGATTFHTVRVGGRERSYMLHLPAGMTNDVPRPLVLVFHGNTGNATTVRAESNLDAVSDRFGYEVAYLNGTGSLRYADLTWNVRTCCGFALRHRVDDVGFARAVVDALATTEHADRSRVYAAGLSSGGTLALLLACDASDLVAGVASVAGTMPETPCEPARRLTVLLVRGERDDELARDHAENAARGSPAYATSFDAAQAFWAARDGCAGATVRDSTPLAAIVRSADCPTGVGVEQVIVRGQGHAWPGGAKPWWFSPAPSPLDGASLMLELFSRAAAR
ncbi:lipoprotein [Gemmatirosa kalamazoonensis]|jgi:polyhydroxybutyrate depolymerase|uniref:Lipoprotein n=1 Tax=Gemmatirosa kalamazoonensis TaxID=861299 RepID=W0RM94_9BACT|nr:PHB depolymerase family esterase [Gemmatirosa kalamazoonensis]AHG90563.1 lipoprotein [Gemmatirosa kalamazoonensis]